MRTALSILLLTAVSFTFARAAEISSNGLGGGRWSDPSTWRGGTAPTAEDEVVVAARDTILFDRDDADKATCKQLILDPGSNFAFQSGLGKRTLTVNGPIEAYGSLKMHAPALTDEMEIRLMSTVPADRVIKLARGGALLVRGRPDLPKGRYNAAISVSAPPVGKIPAAGQLTAATRTVIDLQNARVDNIAVSATGIDNTGAKPNERCNFSGNRFTGYSTLALYQCDTPAVVKNEFEAAKGTMIRPAALSVGVCPLADVRGNRIVGQYAIGINVASSECSVSGNVIESCAQGISWHTGTAMLTNNTIKDCKVGLNLRTTTGSAQETTIDSTELPLSTAAAKVQFTTVVITNPPNPAVMETTVSSVTLINCNVRPDQVKSAREDKTLPRIVSDSDPAVETLQFLVVGVKGSAPPRAQVAVATSNPAPARAPGAADANVRNSPALLRPNGMTALPQTLAPLIVKGWSMDGAGKVSPAPEYKLDVLEPAPGPDAKPRVLKTMSVKPDDTWFRPQPNEPKPTLQVSLP